MSAKAKKDHRRGILPEAADTLENYQGAGETSPRIALLMLG